MKKLKLWNLFDENFVEKALTQCKITTLQYWYNFPKSTPPNLPFHNLASHVHFSSKFIPTLQNVNNFKHNSKNFAPKFVNVMNSWVKTRRPWIFSCFGCYWKCLIWTVIMPFEGSGWCLFMGKSRKMLTCSWIDVKKWFLEITTSVIGTYHMWSGSVYWFGKSVITAKHKTLTHLSHVTTTLYHHCHLSSFAMQPWCLPS